MLGEKLGEETGKIIEQKVLPAEGRRPKREMSYVGRGKLLGLEVSDKGTYWSALRDDGYLEGAGHGVVMTQDGETVFWTRQGVGRFTGPGGAVCWRGDMFYTTNSERLAHLKGTTVVFDYDVDEGGNIHEVIWE